MTFRALAALTLVLTACVAPTDAPPAPAIPPEAADQAKVAPGFPFWLTHLPGQATDVSDSGDVVGFTYAPGQLHAWHYRAGTVRQLAAHPLYPLGFWRYYAQAVNNRSEIVGVVLDFNRNVQRGLYWASPTSVPVFIYPEQAGKWWPTSINDNGEVVGMVSGLPAIPQHAFRWRRGGAPSALPAPNGPWAATTINDHGDIAGASIDDLRLVRLLAGGTYTELPTGRSSFVRMLSNGSMPVLAEGLPARIWRTNGSVVDATNPATGLPIGEQEYYAVSSRGRAAWTVYARPARTATSYGEHVLDDPASPYEQVIGVTACGSVVTNGAQGGQGGVVSLWLKVTFGCDAPTPLP